MLGRPIGHSLSPTLHRAAYAALGLGDSWRYEAIDCGEAELAGRVDALGPEWAGLSLTMPLKRVALDVADEVSPLAAAVGAANTLLLGERRRADNTDVAGIVAALREVGVGAVDRALVLGAGGTAQAALAALRELGATTPTVLVRDVARAGELRAAAERLGVTPDIRAGLPPDPPTTPPAQPTPAAQPTPPARATPAPAALAPPAQPTPAAPPTPPAPTSPAPARATPAADPPAAGVELPAAEVVISTLPAGAADHLRAAGGTVLDVVYAPWPTPFAARAAGDGARVVSGLAMLLHQAAAQVELMTGRPAPLAAMRAALDDRVTVRT